MGFSANRALNFGPRQLTHALYQLRHEGVVPRVDCPPALVSPCRFSTPQPSDERGLRAESGSWRGAHSPRCDPCGPPAASLTSANTTFPLTPRSPPASGPLPCLLPVGAVRASRTVQGTREGARRPQASAHTLRPQGGFARLLTHHGPGRCRRGPVRPPPVSPES